MEVSTRTPLPFPDSLWGRVDKVSSPHGCWLFTGSRDRLGYGRTHVPALGKTQLSHRVAYTLLVGPIPEGLVLDHRCRTPSCVNPAHLEPVTIAENNRRTGPYRAAAVWTQCKNGHEMTPENTYVPTGRRYRVCRTCERARNREYHRRNRDAVSARKRRNRNARWTSEIEKYVGRETK